MTQSCYSYCLAMTLIVLSIGGACAKQQREVIVYTDDAYPPYSYQIEGQATGIYPEILAEIFSQMEDFKVRIEPIPFKRGLKMLESGRGFALAPPYYYANQRFYIQPYSLPILDEEVVVYCNKHIQNLLPSSPIWPEDYFQFKIGINEAYAVGGEAFSRARKAGKIQVIEGKSNAENILRMAKRKIDCYVNDKLSILWETKRLKQQGKLAANAEFLLAALVSQEQGYLAFTAIDSHYPYKKEFIEQFNYHLHLMKQKDGIQKILNDFLSP